MNAKMEILSSRRQTNIELCRIISIMLVLLVHSDFAVFGWPSSWEEPNVPLLALESFAIIGVNVFVFISGYFSVKVKKSSLTKLLFICLFCAFVKIVFDALFEERIALMNFFFVSKSNWFIPAYLGLILLSPFLNAFCEKTTKRELGRILFALIIFEAYFGFFPAFDGYAVKVISHGLSVFHFVVLYLIARYIRLFGIPHFLKKYCFVFYICCSLLLTSLAFILIKTNHQSVMIGKDNLVNQLFDYSNPLVIFSSVCFFLTFVKLSNNKIVARLGGGKLCSTVSFNSFAFAYQ